MRKSWLELVSVLSYKLFDDAHLIRRDFENLMYFPFHLVRRLVFECLLRGTNTL